MGVNLDNVPNCEAIDNHSAEMIHGGGFNYRSRNSTGHIISAGYEASNTLRAVLSADTARAVLRSDTPNARFMIEITELDEQGRLADTIVRAGYEQQGNAGVAMFARDFPGAGVGERPVGIIVREFGPAPGGQLTVGSRPPGFCGSSSRPRSSGSCPGSFSVHVS